MKTILLVEDDENDALFLRHAWEKIGFAARLEIAADGQKAIEYLEATQHADGRTPVPSLVLLDLNLPKKTGLQVLSWIRNHPVLRTLVVIVLTSSSAQADVAAAYALCANSYLVKPSDPAALMELVGLLRDYWMNWNHVAECAGARSHPGSHHDLSPDDSRLHNQGA
jgi:CheY-like chemotaxis protein